MKEEKKHIIFELLIARVLSHLYKAEKIGYDQSELLGHFYSWLFTGRDF